jgi:hypothetical protein
VLKEAVVAGAILTTAEVRGADLAGMRGWGTIASVSYLEVSSVRHAPTGFVAWALGQGAVHSDGSPVETSTDEPSFSQEWRSG